MTPRRIVGVVTGLAAEAQMARGLGMVLAGGGTVKGAERVAATLLSRGATSLISFGLAGGLDPALRPGQLVVAAAVLHNDTRLVADPVLVAALGGVSHKLLLAGNRVVASATDKRMLFRATGAVAVDVESGAVAWAASQAGVPFAVLRAICDPAERNLPAAALLALDGAGAVGLGRVLRSLAAEPGQLPTLLALARDASKARAALIRRVGDIRRHGRFVG